MSRADPAPSGSGTEPQFSAVILAGGESLRMGRDKAWLKWRGQPLIRRSVVILRKLGIKEIFISGRAGVDYASLNCPVLLDRKPGFGPLAGIERALDAAKAPLILVLAVDLPRMTAGILRKITGHCDAETGVVSKLNGRLEPLVAVYPKRCRALAADALARHRHAARDFAQACLQQRAVRLYDVAASDASGFTNWNRPQPVHESPAHDAQFD